jgi:putative protease
MDWVRTLEKKSSDRRIGLWAHLAETPGGFVLTLTDEDGHTGSAQVQQAHQSATDAAKAEASLREQLGRFGASIFAVHAIALQLSEPWFVPASVLNALRRDALADLQENRAHNFVRLPRATPVEPPVPYPEDTLSFLGNVFNHKAHDFYGRHGVKVIAAAYEAHEEEGEVSLMITKHCVRFSMSLCPKQAKGVTGVQGTIRAEPLMLINGKEKLTLRFDCKPCEMHVVGCMKRHVLQQASEFPVKFYTTRPQRSA